MLLSVCVLAALISTAAATPGPQPAHSLKQASRAEVVRRFKRGVRPRAPVPSGAGGAPFSVDTSPVPGRNDHAVYERYFTGSGVLLSATPSGEFDDPSKYTTFANTVSTQSAAQQCVDFAFSQFDEYSSATLWYDESDNIWRCRITYGQNDETDFTDVDPNANPVYGFNTNDE